MGIIGKRILSYEIKSLIAEGGMGDVYLAEHVQLGRKVAIKSLHAQLVRNEGIRQRFKQEASVMAHLQHNGIVGLYDFLEEPDALYLVMEYVDGMPLDEYIQKVTGPIPAERAVQIMAQVLEAFSYAHERGIVHRDIKPSNILITKQGYVKVLDFGIAKMMNDAGNKLTRTGTQMGTVYYMSPEQVQGKEIDFRTDIYSLGVTLFQVLTGTSPYNGITTEFEVYSRIVSENIPAASSVYPGVPSVLDQVIAKATSKRKEDRFQNCLEFSYALHHPEHFLQQQVQFAAPVVSSAQQHVVPAATAQSTVDNVAPRPLYNMPSIIAAVLSVGGLFMVGFASAWDLAWMTDVAFCLSLAAAITGIIGLVFKKRSGSGWQLSLVAFALVVIAFIVMAGSGDSSSEIVADDPVADYLKLYDDSVKRADSMAIVTQWQTDSILAVVRAQETADSTKLASQAEVVLDPYYNEDETVFAPEAEFTGIWLEHNAYDNGRKGMKIHVSFNVSNFQNETGKVSCYFFDADGDKVYGSGSFTADDGNIAVSRLFFPSESYQVYDDFSVFMPYSAMTMEAGSYKVRAQIWHGDESLDISEFEGFERTN